jgi:hypothetical protein
MYLALNPHQPYTRSTGCHPLFSFMNLAFIPGFTPSGPRFLGRFLAPVADGVAAHYVRAYSRPGDLVLDPFGQSPSVAIEALSLDRRVVVASTNPILRLALSLAVRPPGLSDLKAALTALGDAPVGLGPGERLEVQIKAMYQTTCADCGAPASADSFEWDAEAGQPVEKHYVCLNCGGPRHAPADDDDRALARRFGRGGPNYHYLLSRTADPDDADRTRADETLAVYPPRTLAAIAAVLLKLETLDLERETRRLLAGLLVAAFDATTTLAQDRPKVLSVPRRYREVNFWLALEGALGLLAGPPAPDRSTSLAELLAQPGQPAIYAHAGPVRDLEARLPQAGCVLIIGAPPRPNQAFWTLSSVWAAWLWDRESAEALRATLHRRRFDWTWHARALRQPLAVTRPMAAPDGRLVCLVGEVEPGFTSSLVVAAAGAGFELKGWALRADTAEAQLQWAPGQPAAATALETEISRLGREAAIDLLQSRAEPSRWSRVHFAAWCGLAAARLLPWQADEPLAVVNRALESVWDDAETFQHLSDATGDDPASGLWYLAERALALPAAAGRPLADRVEAEVLGRLASAEPVEEHDLLDQVYTAFPGQLTPGRALVMACLASYALQGASGLWQRRPEDASPARTSELQSILAELRALAGRQGFAVTGANPQAWQEAGQNVYVFAVLSSAVISHYLLGPQIPARRRFLVLPGGRAGLVEHKLRHDPRLRQALTAGEWTIVKFRHVRQMLADASVTRATLEPALTGDPLAAMQQLTLPERGDKSL